MSSSARNTVQRKGLRTFFGFLFTASCIITLFSYSAYLSTSLDTVERIGVAVSRGTADIQSLADLYYPEFVKLAGSDPEAELVLPGLGLSLGVKAKEINNVSRDKAGDFVAGAIIRRIYNEGFSNVYNLSSLSGAEQNSIQSLAGIVDSFVNKQFNSNMRLMFIISVILGLVFAVPFFLMSPGFRKFTGFGTAFIIAGLPSTILWFVQSRLVAGLGAGDTASGLLDSALVPLMAHMRVLYISVLLLGAVLYFAGMSGIFLTKRRASLTTKSTE
ncbi:MAG TPA: hypothetical protein VGK02_06410 [Candidatus Aquicultor sp.]|jgi:hypothetical protein